MAGWDEEPLGTFGSGAQVPTGQWFGVDTSTGGWQLPGVPPDTIAANVSSVPSLGAPDQAPLAIGQASGVMAPAMTTPKSMQRVQRLDAMGALPEQPSMWGQIARSVGMLSPQGRAILQASDQQQQQQLQNRLTMRRQALQEEQNERAEIRDDFNSLLKLSEIKSKKLRQLYTDRFMADMEARGKTLPPDFVEAFKTSTGDEAKAMVKFYEPLLTDLGLDPTAFAELVDQGGIKEVGEALTLAQKLKKDKTEQARLAALDTIADGTLGDVSGTAAPTPPAVPGAPTPTTTARQPRAAPSQEISAAIDDSSRLYPQVRKDLLTSIAASESNNDPKAVSPKGAQGVMQLMPGTAKEMGVEDPFNVQQNVRGGTRYFAQMLTKYKGNEALALAAYNWGPGNVDKVGGDFSKMPAETQNYVKTTLQRASAGGGGTTTAAGKPDTRMMVAGGTGAPAPATATGGTPQEQQALTRLDQDIAFKLQQAQRFSQVGGEEGHRRAIEARAELAILRQQRDRLEDRMTEGSRALQKQQLLEPGELKKAEAAKALTPIDRMTQQSLATNKSVYRSIGKIEQYFREGTDLPENFVNLVAQDAPGIRAAMQADPKNATGILQQWETKLQAASKNDPNVNRFLSALGNMRDLIIRERSGGSVTGNELDRAMGAFMGSLPNVNQAFSLFVQNLANVKEMVMDELVTAGAAARPLSGGKAMYGTLPKEVRERIDYAERGEDYPKATMPATSSATTTPNAPGGHPVGVVRPGPVMP